MREVALILGLVDRRIGGRVDDEIGCQAVERASDGIGSAEVEQRAIGRNEGAERSESRQQSSSDLPGHAG
jgi:hypothetical protein